MDDFRWPRALNRVLTNKWHHLKNTLVIKDIVDHLIQERVVTLEYWMSLKSKPVTESERTEDFLSLVMKFDRQKYNKFLEALLLSGRHDLVKELAVTSDGKLAKGSNANGNNGDAVGDQVTQDMHAPYSKRVVEKTFTTEGKRDTIAKPYRNTATNVKKDLPKTRDIVYRNKHGPEAESHKVKELVKPKLPDISTDQKRNPGSNNRESMLDIREKQLQMKETELERMQRALEEHELGLNHKESDLLERESTYESSHGPQSLPTDIQTTNLPIEPASAFSTESGDILAMLREQLAELKCRMDDTEDVQTPTPNMDYVKITDMQNVQRNMAYIKEVIDKDKEYRDRLQKKHEEQKRVVDTLNEKIASVERQKNESERHLQKQVNNLKMDVKHSKVTLNESVSGIQAELKSRETDCEQLARDMGDAKQGSVLLEDRIAALERDNVLAKIELQKYETRITELQSILERKEGELNEFRTMLQDTEHNKDELMDEVTELKDEVNKLRAEKRGLEQERKTLIGGCVKPQWNRNTRHMSNLK